MKKFLGVIVSVGAFVIIVGAAVAQTEHGSGHEMTERQDKPTRQSIMR